MTLPTRPTPTRQHGDYTFVYVQAPTGSFTLAAQVTEATGGQEESMDKWRTVGSGSQRASNDTKYPVSLTLLAPQDIVEAALFLGVIEPGGGWLGSEKLKVDPTKEIQIKFVDYSAATALIVHTELWTDVNWDKLERKTTATGNKTWTLSGTATLVEYIPAAG